MPKHRYPRGQLNADDQGQFGMAITVQDGTIIIAFPKPVTWIGLGYDEAKAIGEALLKRAEEIRQ
jgi:hypothetical protein